MKKLVLNSVIVGIIGIGVLVCKTPTPPWERAPEISYSNTAFSYTRGTAIDPMIPSFSDTEGIGVTVDPALPTGLKIDSTTGVISGVPQVASPKTDYTVTVTNLNGSTDATLSITVVPQKATSLTSLEVTEKTALLSWEQTGDADSFTVYRATSRTGDYSTAGTSLDTFYLDTGLTSETTYYYSVVTLANGVSSRRSDTIETTTSAPTIPTYTVTYHGNGNSSGEVPTDGSTYEEGATVTVLGNSGNLALPGFTFSGWATDAAGAGTIYAADETFAMGSSNVTLYAKWVQNPTYTVTFDKNDTDATGTMDPQRIVSGLSANLTANAYTKANWYFAGWATTSDGSVEYSDEARYTMGTSDVTLYAKWTQDPIYTITFDKNDTQAEGTMTAQRIVTNTTVALSENQFTKAGWSFAGWSTTSDGSVEYADKADFTMGGADVTLYAQWTVNSYTITFDKNDNDATGTMADQSMESGATAALSANQFSKDGWSFAGWSTTAGGSVEYTDGADFTMGTENVTLYAKWTQNPTYTVIYDDNGKTSGTVPSDTNYYEQGETVTVLGNTGNLARTGYTFSGWTTDTTGNGTDYVADDTFPMGTSSVRLYAKWSLNASYTVAFLKNSSTATGEMTPQSIVSGMSETLKANAFENAGWYFAGWSTVSGEASVEYSDKASYTMGTADDTLYAQWTQNELHTVTFLPNDAKATEDTTHQSIPSGLTVTLSQNEFHKPGWSFDGWAEHPDSAKTYDNGASYTMGTADDTLYATWVANDYTITFKKDHQDATGSMGPQVIACEDAANLSPNEFTNEGFTFKGWATETGGTSVAYNDEAMFTMDTTDVTLYAVWEANEIEITFDANDAAITGTATGSMAKQSITFGTTEPLDQNQFALDGYTFVGWATGATGTKAYNDGADYFMNNPTGVTLYAVWSANPTWELSYFENGGTGIVPSSEPYEEGETVTIAGNPGNISLTGYTFSGWRIGGSGQVYKEGETIQMGTENIVFWAYWVIDTFKVTFNPNYSGGTIEDTQVVYNTAVNVPTDPTRTGHKFEYWYKAGSSSSFEFGTKITADITLYAKWTAVYTVTYHLNAFNATGVLPVDNTSYLTGQWVSVKGTSNLSRPGYSPCCWNMQADGGGTTDYRLGDVFQMGNSSIHLYAQWDTLQYIINYLYVDGAINSNPDSYNIEDTPMPLQTLEKYGYTFLGWYSDPGFNTKIVEVPENSTGEKTYYAKWSKNKPTITVEPTNMDANESGTVTFNCQASGADLTYEWQRMENSSWTNVSTNQSYQITTSYFDDNGAAFRCSVYNDAGSVTSAEVTLTVRPGALDSEGNFYPAVKIGNQWWTTVNLRSTKYRDGYTEIRHAPSNADWSTVLSLPAYCFYNNTENEDSIKTFGALYNWYAISTGNLAPSGWHVPSRTEWETLRNYVSQNGYDYYDPGTGAIAKALADSVGWSYSYNFDCPGNSLGENNATGFSGFPAGSREGNGFFDGNGDFAFWWTQNESSAYPSYAWFYDIYYDDNVLETMDYDKKAGYSVRLVRD